MKLQAAVILVIYCLGVFTVHMVKGSIGSRSMRRESCVRLSKHQPNIQSLVNYVKQDGPVRAIMFIDRKGIKICVSPDQKWVPIAIRKIDQKRSTKSK